MKQFNRKNIQIPCVNSEIKKSPSRMDELLTYAISNVISVVSAVGAFLGGIIILIYLMDENYFPPDMNASSIGLLLAAASIIGIVFTTLFALYFILPGYIYRNLLADWFKEDAIKFLGNRAIFYLLDLPAVVVTMLLAISATLTLKDFDVAVLPLWLAAYGIVLLASTAVYYPTSNSNTDMKPWRNIKYQDIEFKKICLTVLKWRGAYIVSTFSFIMVCVPSLFLLLLASLDVADTFSFVFAILAMGVVVLISNHVVAIAKAWWILLLISFVSLLFILAFSHQMTLIPRMAVHALTIGDIRNATLQLDEQGCQIAMKYSSASSEVKKSKPTLCTLAPVRIVWRIGNEYWLSFNEVKTKAVRQAKETTSASLSFVVDDKDLKIECSKVEVTTKLTECSSTAVDVNKLKSESLSFEPNSKFSLPASHVLSWAVKPPQAVQSQK